MSISATSNNRETPTLNTLLSEDPLNTSEHDAGAKGAAAAEDKQSAERRVPGDSPLKKTSRGAAALLAAGGKSTLSPLLTMRSRGKTPAPTLSKSSKDASLEERLDHLQKKVGLETKKRGMTFNQLFKKAPKIVAGWVSDGLGVKSPALRGSIESLCSGLAKTGAKKGLKAAVGKMLEVAGHKGQNNAKAESKLMVVFKFNTDFLGG